MNLSCRSASKKNHQLTNSFKSGFTLVETLVSVGVLGIFFAAIAIILQQVLQNVGESRVRATATALGMQKMEIIRNLSYTSVGTAGGIPSGTLPQSETNTINNQDFIVTTSIIYIDDPFDTLAPTDTVPTDYKRVRIEITWGGAFPSRLPVTYVTNIVPKGIETIAGGGTLYIQVFNASGLPVANATIQIDNTAVTPAIHMSTLTNSNGIVILPGSPACITCYQISVTKTGYSTDRTYSQTEVANPLQPYTTMLEGQISQVSFAIDQISSIIVNSYGSRQSGYPPIAGVQFSAHGTKLIGYDTNDNPIYKYNYSTNSGGGTVTLSGLEWDSYTFDFSNSGYNLAGSNPVNPVALPPATNLTLQMTAVPKTNTSLLVVMQNSSQQLAASASAELINASLSYDATVSAGVTGTPDVGQAFFGGLIPTTYDLKITALGYQDATSSVAISGISQQTVTLNPIP